MEEEWDRGWRSGPAKTVCADHLEDDALVSLVVENASDAACSYCQRSGSEPFAVDIDLLIERIATSLQTEWGSADDEAVAWDEGDYVGETYDSWDLLQDLGILNDRVLFDDVVNALPEHRWAQRDFYLLRPDQRLIFGWENFGDIVKHRRRYFFADHRPEWLEHDPDYVAPGAMLEAIGDAIRRSGLVRRLDAGTTVWRVRAHRSDEHPVTATELGATPVEYIRASGRMNPAGVPLFYGALEERTAITEARDANPKAEAFTLGRFELLDAIEVVDLAHPPDVPSLFDNARRDLRPATIFLGHFAEAVSEPFERDDKIHIEYVPTQVVTEWLRTRFSTERNGPHGISYASARAPGGVNLALFVDNDGAVDPEDAHDEPPALLVLRDHRRL